MCKLSILICADVAARRLADPTVPPNVVSTKEPQMPRMISRIRRFLASEDAPTAAEYAVMLVFIVPVIIAAVASLGTTVSGTFSSASSIFGGGS